MANPILYPNVGGAPGSIKNEPAQPSRVIDREVAQTNGLSQTPANAESFEKLLGSQLDQQNVKEPLKFSAHASARIQSRKIDMSPDQMRKLNDAIDKAAAKGLDDTLVLTKDGAFIVSVKNRTVVTAMDRNALEGNVFTNIDGAVIV